MLKKFKVGWIFVLLCLMSTSQAQNLPPKPFGPTPSSAQLAWQKMEVNMFCHFGPNTFTGKEWGEGTEPEDVFNPTSLDCNQWAATAKAAGFGGIILTAKHHDGFCLWPNPASKHTVKQSAWRKGGGDVLEELSAACQKAEIGFGIYISPWDRNAPTYGTPKYNKVFLKTLRSALSNYGPVFEQWFDGANGEGPNGKRQVYDWPAFNNQVYALQPAAVIFSDVGPGCRWVGNEEGKCGETCWSRLDTKGREPGKNAPSQDTLNGGNYNGAHWIPAETDVSIRPGWFYRDSEHPKSLNELLNIYYTSVGRNSLLLLNVPPDQHGLIAREDSLRLMEFRTALDAIFAHDLAQDAVRISASNTRGSQRDEAKTAFSPQSLLDGDYDTYWTTDDSVCSAEIALVFAESQTFNRILLQEYIPLGQRVERFRVDVFDENGQRRTIARGTTIGYKRIVLTEPCTTDNLYIVIEKARACPVLNKLALYMDTITQTTP